MSTKRVGEIGYTFRKLFHQGWFVGEVVEIRPGAAEGKDRRCIYEDGDSEDLSVPELKALAKLDPLNKRTKSKNVAKMTASNQTQSFSRISRPESLATNDDKKDDNSIRPGPVRRSQREPTVNVKLAAYYILETQKFHKEPSQSSGSVRVRRCMRDRKPTRSIEEVYLAQHLQRAPSNKRAASNGGYKESTKIRKLLSSLNDDDVPVDRAAENTIEEPADHKFANDECLDSESELEDTNQWLQKVASQLGAAAKSHQTKNRSRPVSRNSVASSSDGHLNGSIQSYSLGRSSHGKITRPDVSSVSSTISYSSANIESKVPASVLVSKPRDIHISGTEINPRTLLDVDRGTRHGYLVFNRDDPKRVVGEVIVEGDMGWVEVSFGGSKLVKCRSSHLILVPSDQFKVGDTIPLSSTYNVRWKSSSSANSKIPPDIKCKSNEVVSSSSDKKTPPTRRHDIDIDELFYWYCECDTFNSATKQVCQTCMMKRSKNAYRSKLLEIAEDAVHAESVNSLDEAMIQIPESDRPSIPESIIARLLESKVAGVKFSDLCLQPSTDIDSYFYWICGTCTMQNTFRKGSCAACGETKGYSAKCSPLLHLAEEVAQKCKTAEDASAVFAPNEIRQMPHVVMEQLVTCVYMVGKRGSERRCRKQKLKGLDFCAAHCDPSLLVTRRITDEEKETLTSAFHGKNSPGFSSSHQRGSSTGLSGISSMKVSLQSFLETRVNGMGNKLQWDINNIEDSILSASDSQPFPLGLKVRTYFHGYGCHDGRIIKVRREFWGDSKTSQDRPVLMYRVIYNDGDQQDWLHHNILSLRQVYDTTVDPEASLDALIPPGSLFKTRSGDAIKVLRHKTSSLNEQVVVFALVGSEDSREIELNLLKFQLAVARRFPSAHAFSPSFKVSNRAAAMTYPSTLEWPVSIDRLSDYTATSGANYSVNVCNGLRLMNKSHNEFDPAVLHIKKPNNVDNWCDVRRGCKLNRWDPGNTFNFSFWDPSQCLVCEICGIDKDDNQVVICDKCHSGFHTYCLRPVMVNIPENEWVCIDCSSNTKSLSFLEFSESLASQQKSVLEFLNLPFSCYNDYTLVHADALTLFVPSSFNRIKQKAINEQPKKTLFRVGSVSFVRSPQRNDWRLPSPVLTVDEYAQSIESFVAAMKYCGMTSYSESCIYPPNGSTTEEMNDPALDEDVFQPLSKRNLSIFLAFKENLTKGIFPPVKIVHDEKYGFSVEALKSLPTQTLIAEYTGEVMTLEESSDSDSLMILLHSGNPKTSLIIDPTRAGNIARFLGGVNNRSLVSRRKANVRTRRFCLDGRLRVALFTSRRIEPGEKLSYDYNAGRKGQSSEQWLKGGFYDTSNFF